MPSSSLVLLVQQTRTDPALAYQQSASTRVPPSVFLTPCVPRFRGWHGLARRAGGARVLGGIDLVRATTLWRQAKSAGAAPKEEPSRRGETRRPLTPPPPPPGGMPLHGAPCSSAGSGGIGAAHAGADLASLGASLALPPFGRGEIVMPAAATLRPSPSSFLLERPD
jgi:hypothetical protein